MLLFPELGVDAVLPVLVILFHGLLHRFNRETEFLREFLDRVRLLHEAALDQPREHLVLHDKPRNVGLSAVREGPEAGAAVHLELLRVLRPVAVKDRVVSVILVVFVCVERILVRAGFVDEAFTKRIHLQPRLRSHPEPGVVARLQGLETRLLIRADRGAVKLHCAVRLVHLGTDPEAGLDAVAERARHRAGAGDDAEVPGLERFHHLVVTGVAAGRNHRALLRDVADVLPVTVLSDTASHAAVLLLELHHLHRVVEAGTLADRILVEEGIELLAFVRADFLAGVAGGVANVAGGIVLVTHFVHHLDAVFFQPVTEPVDRFAGVIRPDVVELLLHVAARVTGRPGGELELVDLRPFFLLIAGVDRAEVTTDAGAGGEAVNTNDLAAVLSSGAHSEHAAGTAADHEDVGGHGVHDVLLTDLGGLPEPVAGVFLFRRFLRDHFNRDLALRLRDALRGGLADGGRRD